MHKNFLPALRSHRVHQVLNNFSCYHPQQLAQSKAQVRSMLPCAKQDAATELQLFAVLLMNTAAAVPAASKYT